MPASKNIRYIAAIDHLRAYAASLVLLYHSVHVISYHLLWGTPFKFDHWPAAGNPLTALIYEGHTGVSLFMVLSGFIFTYGGSGREINYPTFLRNRILRIYPLMLAITFIGIAAFPEKFTLPGFIQTLLPLQNTAGSLDLGAYNSMFWTIAVEFQFYLIFPFLYRMLIYRGIRHLALLILFVLVARWSALLLGGNPRDFSYWTILGHLDQFLIGMITASFSQRFSVEARPSLLWALPVVVSVVAIMLFLFNRHGGWPAETAWKILWPTLEAALWALVIVAYLAALRGRNGFFSRLFAGVGTVSYSMYLLHFIVITIALKHSLFFNLPGRPFLSSFLTGVTIILPVTICVSILTYLSIEKPFLALRRRYLIPPPGPQQRSLAPGKFHAGDEGAERRAQAERDEIFLRARREDEQEAVAFHQSGKTGNAKRHQKQAERHPGLEPGLGAGSRAED